MLTVPKALRDGRELLVFRETRDGRVLASKALRVFRGLLVFRETKDGRE